MIERTGPCKCRAPELIPVLGSHPAGDRSHKPGGRLPLLSTRTAVTSPGAEHHRPLAGTKLYCLVTEAHVYKQLAQGCTRQRGVGFEPATCWSPVRLPNRSATEPHQFSPSSMTKHWYKDKQTRWHNFLLQEVKWTMFTRSSRSTGQQDTTCSGSAIQCYLFSVSLLTKLIKY